MWKIKQIFDGEYGCEELLPGDNVKVTVFLENDAGEEKSLRVEDDWLIKHGIDVGSAS
jgi:hypothetical protein